MPKNTEDEVVYPITLRVSVGDSSQEKVIRVKVYPKTVPIAQVTAGMGITIQPKGYSALRLDASVTEPCVNTKKQKAKTRAAAFEQCVESLMEFAPQAREAFKKLADIIEG